MALSIITVPNLENEIGLLNFNRLVDNSRAVDSFVKGFSDAFVDETGVNTGSNSNSTYDSATDTYTPVSYTHLTLPTKRIV